MKRVYARMVLAAFLIILGSSGLMAAEISFFIGDVTLTRNGKAVQVDVGVSLNGGDLITTGKDSEVQISYADGSTVKIQEKTTVRIGSNGLPGTDNISVHRGAVQAKFSRMAKGERRVVGPAVICGVRGTQFTFSVSERGDSRVDLSEGAVENRNTFGRKSQAAGSSSQAVVGRSPEEGRGTAEEWRAASDSSLAENPGAAADSYSTCVRAYERRSSESGNRTRELGKKVKKMRPETASGTEEEIARAEEGVIDDYLMNETAAGAIEWILNDFKDRRTDMYNTFQAVKEESNRVREVQRQNYEALQAVREEYRKNYELIMGTHRKEKERIREGTRDVDTKPRFVEE